MDTRLILAIGTAAWLITANSASADEVESGSNKAEASQTATTAAGSGDSSADEALPTRRSTPLGSNEWRRNDSSGHQGRPSDGRPGGGRSGGSGGEGGESGGDGGAID